MRSLILALALLMPLTANAESRLPFLKDRVPDGVEFLPMDPRTGQIFSKGNSVTVTTAFKKDMMPPK